MIVTSDLCGHLRVDLDLLGGGLVELTRGHRGGGGRLDAEQLWVGRDVQQDDLDDGDDDGQEGDGDDDNADADVLLVGLAHAPGGLALVDGLLGGLLRSLVAAVTLLHVTVSHFVAFDQTLQPLEDVLSHHFSLL